MLITSPLLAYPTMNQAFILKTDASKVGLGAVLSQIQSDGKEHPVAYASRALSHKDLAMLLQNWKPWLWCWPSHTYMPLFMVQGSSHGPL